MAVLELLALAAPIRTNEAGVLLVGESRVRLDTVVTAYAMGSDAEDICMKFDSLELNEVYSVLGYYLRNKIELDIALNLERQRAEVIIQEIREQSTRDGIRDRLLARRSQPQI